MTEELQYNRPNTVSGLKAKHKELSDLREKYREEVKKLTLDLYQLEAVIELFEPGARSGPLRKSVTQPRITKGSLKRFILNSLRESPEPMTSRQLSEGWAEENGLPSTDTYLFIIRKKVGACLKTCRAQGLVEQAGQTTDHDANGPYKLWRITKG